MRSIKICLELFFRQGREKVNPSMETTVFQDLTGNVSASHLKYSEIM